MYLFGDIKNWMRRLKCRLKGHPSAVTIETYQVTIRVKNWVTLGKNLVFVPPYKQFFINGKHKCTKCGVTFLGIIVKEESFHNKPHDIP